jgi:hypothetical protein
MSSDNYIKFGPQETIVQFGTDRGVWKPQPDKPDGGYFFRVFADGRRFACVSKDLERRLLDLNYQSGEQVAISRQTRNRTVMWIVRLLEPATESQPAPAPRPVAKRTPPPLPEAKFAPPPVAWPETEVNGNGHTPKKPNGTAIQPTPAAHGDQTKQQLKEYLFDAVDLVVDTQAYAAKAGLMFTPNFAEIQDIAVSLFIQRSKQSNIEQMDRNQQRRANGGQDPWRQRTQ